MKIVFHYDAGPALAERLKAFAAEGLQVDVCPVADTARFRKLMTDADVLWHVLEPVTEEVMDIAPKLKLIQKFGVGLNTIDLEAAKARDIRVSNLPGTNSRAVAEMTLALMLAALRRIPAFDAATRAGKGWSWDPALQDRLGEVHGRTVGLIGYGAVPHCLAPILAAMGAEVIYMARSAKPHAAGRFCTLDDLIARSDIVSLHVPLTPETERMIDAKAIAAMKPGAILINTARGGLVDNEALAAALRDGRLAAAGLDTFAAEPVLPDDPLLSLDNVVLTPHVAWLTPETLERSFDIAADNVRRLGAGELLHNQVA
ncbi:MAG TPA: 2-hydroxyacid dehydrogenase [Afifellaceae bacterium]|nr:2-hydroxyacid dehydrogenase [Afifellaceae bacterium]